MHTALNILYMNQQNIGSWFYPSIYFVLLNLVILMYIEFLITHWQRFILCRCCIVSLTRLIHLNDSSDLCEDKCKTHLYLVQQYAFTDYKDFKWLVRLSVTLSPHSVDMAICIFLTMVWILWKHIPPGVWLNKYLRTISSESANAPSNAARLRVRLTTK